MAKILVGIDGSVRGERALEWAARRAQRTADELTLISVVDVSAASEAGATPQMVRSATEDALKAALERLAKSCPNVSATSVIVEGKIVESLVDAATRHDMVVLGSHHGATIGEAIGGAKGLRVSVSISAPTVVVPSDWDPDAQGEGIVVGVGPDKVSERAIEFGVREALATGQELDLVSAWGLPPVLTRPAEVLGGGLGPVGEQFQRNLDQRVARLREQHPGLVVSGHAAEGPSPAQVLVRYSMAHRMLVMGTHSRTALGRALFGSVTHGALLNLNVPTVVVPQA